MGKSRVIISDFDPAGPFAGLVLPYRFRKRQNETRFKQEWRLTWLQYAALMAEQFKGRRRQRGSIMLGGGSMMVGGGAQVVLTAHVFLAIVNGFCTSGVSFRRNGQLFEIDSVTGEAEQDGEWWSDEPETNVGDDFAVRHLSSGKIGTYSNEAQSADIWININGSRDWDVDSPTDGTKACDATFEVGPQPSGPADDSGFIELTAVDIGL